MIKLSLKPVFYNIVGKVLCFIFFFSVFLLPCSLNAMMEENDNSAISSRIGSQPKKTVEIIELPQEEKFLEGVSETLLIP
ncbi:MAG: hypothetical protein K2P93_03350, partial [Alphaproteobacteria bacterium]|nr:hypothetical protein [Alphaproteobacteria bacterium]